MPANEITLTDKDGCFTFDVDKGNKLKIYRIGYKTKSINLNTGSEFLVIKLEPKDVEIPGISIKGKHSNSIANKTNNVEVIDFNNNISVGWLNKLENNPGIFIRENSLGEQSISLNGCSQKQIAILVDGIKVNSSAGEHSAIHIPTSLIDKIETSKGSNSSLAGSSAMGGVINFILKEPDTIKNRHTFSFSAGSWHKFSGNYQGVFNLNNLKILMNLHSQTAKNNFSYYNEIEDKELQRQNNGYTRNSFQLKLNQPFTGKINHKLSIFIQKAKKGIPGQTTDYMFYETAKAYSELSRIHSKTIFDFRNSLLNLNLLYKVQASHYENTESDVFHKYDSRNNTRILSYNLSWNYTKNFFSTETGTNFRYESYKFDNLLEEGLEQSIPLKIRRTLSVFTHTELELPTKKVNYKIHSGLRYDGIFDETKVLSFDLGFDINPKILNSLSFSFKAGNSYRLPEFTSLFWKGDSRVQGNPDLEPERARSIETALQWQNDLHKIYLSGFINKIDDLIYWHRTALGVWTPDNLTTAEISGLTAKIQSHPWEILTISSNFTRLNPINKTENSDHYDHYLIYKPLHKWINEIQLNLDKFILFVKSKNIGKQYVNFDNKVELSSYNTCDLGASYKFGSFKNIVIDAKLQLSNIFSESYETYRNIPAPGRAYSFKIQLTIK